MTQVADEQRLFELLEERANTYPNREAFKEDLAKACGRDKRSVERWLARRRLPKSYKIKHGAWAFVGYHYSLTGVLTRLAGGEERTRRATPPQALLTEVNKENLLLQIQKMQAHLRYADTPETEQVKIGLQLLSLDIAALRPHKEED